MKILYVTTISDTMIFFPEHIKMLQTQGNTVDLAANFDRPADSRVDALGCVQYHIPFSRSVCSRDNVKAYFEIKKLIREGNYDIIHTHTPNASAIVRLVCWKMRKQGLRVFYTAHGFHFYKGAPVKNWLLFFPVEWVCARWTDVLITINREDYRLAKRWMRPGRVEYVPGVGIDTAKFRNVSVDTEKKRSELGLKNGDIMLLSVGEISARKNHKVVLQALNKIRDSRIHYVIVGTGPLKPVYKKLVYKFGLASQVHFLGYRADVSELCKITDLYVFPSKQEGLPVALMEAMASGIPIICSNIRGNVDLIKERSCLFPPGDVNALVQCLKENLGTGKGDKIAASMEKTVRENYKRLEQYNIFYVLAKMKVIYETTQ